MNADPSAQARLLDLQAADTGLGQLAHRRTTLPEVAAIAACDERATGLHNDTVEAETRSADLADDQRRLEREVDAVRSRAQRDEQRLQAGGLPAKELESLQHELTTLARRQSTLEDELLEVMEQREVSDGALAELNRQRAALDTERAELIAARDAAFAEIEAASARHADARATIAAELPPDLLALYEKSRAHSGVGAAVLRQRRCEGCHIELSGSELSAVRAAEPDAVVRCDNCRCILVRTAESGL